MPKEIVSARFIKALKNHKVLGERKKKRVKSQLNMKDHIPSEETTAWKKLGVITKSATMY